MTDEATPYPRRTLAQLTAQKERLQKQLAEIQRAERRAKVRKQRQDDTRRKIVAGAFLLKKASDADPAAVALLEELKANMRRSDYRVLFGLPPLPAPAATSKLQRPDVSGLSPDQTAAIEKAIAPLIQRGIF